MKNKCKILGTSSLMRTIRTISNLSMLLPDDFICTGDQIYMTFPYPRKMHFRDIDININYKLMFKNLSFMGYNSHGIKLKCVKCFRKSFACISTHYRTCDMVIINLFLLHKFSYFF